MGTVTGKEYVDRINGLKNQIWIDGERVQGDLSDHPAFRGILSTKAALYDFVQSNPNQLMDASQKYNFSFEIPRTHEQLIKRREAIRFWASQSAGLLGRSPDYVNSAIMAMASYAPFFGEYSDNMKQIYEEAREQDYSFTHTFINPQISRKFYWPDGDDETVIAAKVVKETPEGLVIRGARMLATQGGLTDQLLVLPAGSFTDSSYLFGFSIPSNTPGLSFVCRPSYAENASTFDQPLASRFDEGDAMVVFDDVLVPWKRVFLYGDSEITSNLKTDTGLEAFLLYQSANRQLVKTEWILGIAQLMVESLSVAEYQHIQEKVSEVAMAKEIMNGLILASEEAAIKNEYGVLVPNGLQLKMAFHYYQKTYPRLAEILTLLGASGLICIPTEKDFESPNEAVLSHTLQGERLAAKDKIKLNRMAWDLTMSSFGSRQTLYERLFFGDPVRTPVSIYSMYPKESAKEKVLSFLSIDLE
ncbi:4-hydroxyphenylacetate 3-monooxygenase, oxygenase component [Alkalicoccobacillus porphyridii]|uniref:4-hydroxyphenylacetate 3-monooxygenase, oxygenase component n=1 Tax=Alkalicoccobacillus porphyridii TaxID=2597270 RepID=A0A553ZTW3_9BACI|nr:4-hydroxyphenylacetate 3-monooxygenase, oxygenase component [Alkalicoccobacillus porphyridii]TSB44908.1 4-hydroxyphenylacetate 3-monooxygenase, oxygenase component [Alkalicoccobacillus porphyridii]